MVSLSAVKLAAFPRLERYSPDVQASSDMAPSVVSSLARQIRQLATAPPDGVRFYPNEKGLSEIDASIDGPGKRWRHLVSLQLVASGRQHQATPTFLQSTHLTMEASLD